jgi:hypothetical protein
VDSLDYGCEDTKRGAKRENWSYLIGLVLPLSENVHWSSSPNNELFSQEMHLKISLVSKGLKLSNFNPGWSDSALSLLCTA